MRFFQIPYKIIKKDSTYSIKENDSYVDFHGPDATLIVDGKLELGENTNSHIFVKNLVITPRGELNVHNSQIIATDNYVNHGKNVLSNTKIICGSYLSTNAETNRNWFLLRSQIKAIGQFLEKNQQPGALKVGVEETERQIHARFAATP